MEYWYALLMPSPDASVVQLDEWTEAYEEAEAARVRAQQAAMTEDGWTVVVRSKASRSTWAPLCL